jgi:NAD(P)H-hydrate epimerase
MPSPDPCHPILTCAEAKACENHLLGDNAELIWAAMNRAGAGVGAAIVRDFTQWRPLPRDPRVLVLAGPGHNGGDALLAAREILRARPRGRTTVVLLEPADQLKLLTRRAWDELAANSGVQLASPEQLFSLLAEGQRWDITLAGLYGLSFHPPLSAPARTLIQAANDASSALGFRAAIDLPSGIGDTRDELAFIADFTYATGIAKQPLFSAANAPCVGRIRYIDIGFFAKPYDGPRAYPENLLLPAALEFSARLRNATGSKRHHGNLIILSGSRSYPGAQLLNVLGALRAGVGLVTALTPFTFAAAFAAARPEAMWRACPEEPDGSHGAGSLGALRELLPRASALLAGSGLGRSPATQAMLQMMVKTCLLPLVLDADALMPKIITAVAERPDGAGPVIITPHAGEFERIAGENADLAEFSRKYHVITILKGPVTRISDGTRTWCSPYGGPVLSRGGSGDILAGMVGTMLSQLQRNPFTAATRAVVWHGLAADALARAKGETSVLVSELAAYLPEALRNEWGD